MFTEYDVGTSVYSGAGCGSSARPVLRGFGRSNLAVLLTKNPKEKLLTLFATEKPLLQPLPDNPPELVSWAKVKVHRDGHVQYEKCLYSVPFRLMGQTLWLKASPLMIRIFNDHQLVATHARLFKAGSKHTLDDHLPPMPWPINCKPRPGADTKLKKSVRLAWN